jgi:O-antigen/teichoic acid export membrane protein
VDQAAVGRWLGVTALGYYSLAYTICNLPATSITHVVNKVMYPTYSKLR